jgi:RNA polymerase sigma-70 factor (ECF subfamily)
LPSARVIPFREQDPRLQEEARSAARIVQGIRNGDSAAETQMVERYSRGLRYLLMRRTSDQERARDLLQETLCIAITKLREIELDNPERLAGYLRGIAVRVAMNDGRRRKREPISMEVEALERIPANEPRQFQYIAKQQTASAVRTLLDAMTVKRDRELLMRYYVQDQDKQEICGALGLDSLHFNRVLFRAKARFKKLLEKSADGSELVPE